MNFFKKQKKVGLVSREITRDKYDMRRTMGVSDSELLVYIGVGRSVDPVVSEQYEKLRYSEFEIAGSI